MVMVRQQEQEREERAWDLVIYGATGDAGKAIACYVANNCDGGDNASTTSASTTSTATNKKPHYRIAIAGRSEQKLNSIRSEIIVNRLRPSSGDIGVIVANATAKASTADPMTPSAAMDAMAKSTKLVISAVGPYTTLGESTVRACIKHGTHYVDITGEVDWVAKMKNKYSKQAQETGSTLCSFAGYDCIPSELSIYLALKVLNNESDDNNNNTSTSTSNHKDSVAKSTTTYRAETVVRLQGGTAPRGTIRTSIAKMPTMLQFMQELVNYTPPPERSRTAQSLLLWLLPKWSASLAESEDDRGGGCFTLPHFMGWCNIPVVHHSFAGQLRSFNDRMVVPMLCSDRWYTGYGLIPILGLYSLFLLFVLPVMGCCSVLVVVFPSIAGLVLQLFDSIQYRGNTKNNRSALEGSTVDCTTTVMATDNSATSAAAVVRFFCRGDAGIICTALLAAETAFAMLDLDSQNILSRGIFGTPATIVGDRLVERLQHHQQNNNDDRCRLDVQVIRQQQQQDQQQAAVSSSSAKKVD